MIKPDKHTNPDTSVINISASILKQLNAFYDISYDDLLERVISEVGEEAKENYPYAISFLYLVDKLIYSEKTDSFRYKNAIK